MARNPGKLLTYESRFSNQMLKPSPSYYFISCFLNLSIYHFLFIITFINCLNLLNSSLAFIFFFSFLFQSFFWFFFRENIKKDSNICFLQQLIHDIPSFLPSFFQKEEEAKILTPPKIIHYMSPLLNLCDMKNAFLLKLFQKNVPS